MNVQALKVGADALRGFGGHLDARLQDADGEVGCRSRAEPQTKVFVRLVLLQ